MRAHNTGARTGAWRIVTILVVLAVALSMVAPIAAASTATATSSASTASVAPPEHSGAPSGMVGVPSTNVGPPEKSAGNGPGASNGSGPPMHAMENIPSHAGAWEVHASKHAGDLQVEVGALSSGELALRLTDNRNHEGREVAIARSTLADAVGHAPEMAHGIHESGEEWTAPIRYEGSHAVFEVPHFSSNTVTFDGDVTLSGNPAANGSTYTYNIDSSSGVDSVNATFTGVKNDVNQTTNGVLDKGNSTTIDVDGNAGPSSDSLYIQAQGPTTEVKEDQWSSHTGSWSVNGTHVTNVCLNWDSPTSTTTTVAIDIGGTTYSKEDDPYYDPICFNTDAYTNGEPIEVTDAYSGWGDLNYTETDVTNDPKSADVDVTVNSNSQTESVGTDGKTVNVDLARGSNTLELNSSASSVTQIGYRLNWTESTVSENPTLTVNGQSVSHSGILGEGNTTSLNVDSSWITDGKNNVSIAVSESVDGPTGQVGLSFSHPAPVDQTVSHTAETWTEGYNVSRTWDSATTNASITIPFSSDSVVEIRDLEKRINGGSWEPISSYSLDGTTLTAELSGVSEGDTVEVRANGSKVQVENGAIRVLEPTTEGNSLDTEIEIVDHSTNFGIGVGGTVEGNWVHKTANESWTASETFVTITASGGQTIHAPGASAGSTMRVRTIPMEVSPDAGSVNLTLKESAKELTFDVEPTESVSEVEYRYHDTISGERYVLYSETHGVARDSEIAQSPVSLIGGGYAETLSIILDSGSSSSSGTSGGGGFGGAIGPTSSANPLLVLVIGVAAIAGTAYVARRTGVPMSVVGGTGLLVAILGIETISPGTISDGVRSAIVLLSSQLGPVMPLIALILVGTGAYMAVRWWQGRTGPDTQVTLQLNGGKK